MSLLSWFQERQANLSISSSEDMSHTTRLGESLFGAFCYLFPPAAALALVWKGKDSMFISFQAKQALLLQLIGFLLIAIMPGVLRWVMVAIVLILLFLGVYFSLRKQKWYVPLISDLVEHFEI